MQLVIEPITGVNLGAEYLADEELSMFVVHLLILRLTFFW